MAAGLLVPIMLMSGLLRLVWSAAAAGVGHALQCAIMLIVDVWQLALLSAASTGKDHALQCTRYRGQMYHRETKRQMCHALQDGMRYQKVRLILVIY